MNKTTLILPIGKALVRGIFSGALLWEEGDRY